MLDSFLIGSLCFGAFGMNGVIWPVFELTGLLPQLTCIAAELCEFFDPPVFLFWAEVSSGDFLLDGYL
jgi:hypothetical protein